MSTQYCIALCREDLCGNLGQQGEHSSPSLAQVHCSAREMGPFFMQTSLQRRKPFLATAVLVEIAFPLYKTYLYFMIIFPLATFGSRGGFRPSLRVRIKRRTGQNPLVTALSHFRKLLMLTRIKPIHAILETAEQHALRRSLGPVSLMLLGIGTIIGTGIFVLTAEAAQKAGPAMIVSFCIAGLVCAFAALCYAEMAAMVPVSGSAYTYSYAVVGELLAWAVGWALILEYAIASGAVAVGWSGYFVGLLRELFGLHLPAALTLGPMEGGIVNLPAALLVVFLMGLLLIGTRESARFNAALVVVKISALTLFCGLALPVLQAQNFQPFAPSGLGGISGAAASIFFAYVGFDAVATAAEETRLHLVLCSGCQRGDRYRGRPTAAGPCRPRHAFGQQGIGRSLPQPAVRGAGLFQ
jgi:hypothetical protein